MTQTDPTGLQEAAAEVAKKEGILPQAGKASFYIWLKVTAGIIVCSTVIFSVVGQIYNVPRTLNDHSSKLSEQSTRLDGHDKSITELNQRASLNRQLIDNMQKSMETMMTEQHAQGQQIGDINRSLIELTTTIKHYNETLKEIKVDVRDIKNKN